MLPPPAVAERADEHNMIDGFVGLPEECDEPVVGRGGKRFNERRAFLRDTRTLIRGLLCAELHKQATCHKAQIIGK